MNIYWARSDDSCKLTPMQNVRIRIMTTSSHPSCREFRHWSLSERNNVGLLFSCKLFDPFSQLMQMMDQRCPRRTESEPIYQRRTLPVNDHTLNSIRQSPAFVDGIRQQMVDARCIAISKVYICSTYFRTRPPSVKLPEPPLIQLIDIDLTLH